MPTHTSTIDEVAVDELFGGWLKEQVAVYLAIFNDKRRLLWEGSSNFVN